MTTNNDIAIPELANKGAARKPPQQLPRLAALVQCCLATKALERVRRSQYGSADSSTDDSSHNAVR